MTMLLRFDIHLISKGIKEICKNVANRLLTQKQKCGPDVSIRAGHLFLYLFFDKGPARIETSGPQFFYIKRNHYTP